MALHGDIKASCRACYKEALQTANFLPRFLIPRLSPKPLCLSVLSRAKPPHCPTLDFTDAANAEGIRLAGDRLHSRVYVCNKSKQVLAI